MNLKFVGIHVRPDSPDAERKGIELAAWLQRQGIATGDLNAAEPSMDLLIVLGGDGTLLHAADLASRYGIPILGVHMGNLGFLTEITVDELYKTITMLLAGEYRLERRIMLSAAVVNGTTGAISEAVRALNEVLIVKDSASALIRLGCWANQEYITTYSADGLIIASPTGSTAYNLSAGGPLVHAEQKSLILTPVCPFMLSSRPVLLSSETLVTVHPLAPASQVGVIIDGELHWRMGEDDYLLVQQAARPLLIVSSPWKSYFKILRTKLYWGGDPVDLPLPDPVRRYC